MVGMEDRDAKETELVRRREEELSKISTGIGKVFLHTIRQTERIKNAKLQNIDPRWEKTIESKAIVFDIYVCEGI